MLSTYPIATVPTQYPVTTDTSSFTHPAVTSAATYDAWPSPVQDLTAMEHNDIEYGLPDTSLTQSFEPAYYPPSSVYNVRDWQSHYLPVSSSPTPAIPKPVSHWPATRQNVFPTPADALSYSSGSPRTRTSALVSSPILEFAGFVPYPTPPHKSPIQTSSDDHRIMMMNRLYGSPASVSATRCYLTHYWTSFHPFFPVMHKPTFDDREAGPLLTSAMAAIGAQYSNEQSAAVDARSLHEHCVRFLEHVSSWHL